MYKLHLGNCLDVMKLMPDNCIDSIVTDPPYGISFMGKKWDYDVPSVDIWKECFRVLKPGGHLLSFAGTRTQHRMAVNIEDAGFEIRDLIAWVYGNGFPKSHNLKGEWQGWGTALKPAFEPITVARKPFNTTVAVNILKYGTGGINVDGCRVDGAGPSGLTPYIRSTTPSGYALGMAKAGREVTYSDHPQGRWPANFIHDGSEEVVGLFPETKGGVWNHTAGARHFNNDGEPTCYQTSGSDASTGSAARFFYCAKASKQDRDEGCEGMEEKRIGVGCYGNGLGNAPKIDGEKASPIKNYHPTVKPTNLMRYLCRLVTPPNGLILDPFMGSGSTGKAAILEGFNFEGIDLDEEYLKIAEARIKWAEDQQPLLKDI